MSTNYEVAKSTVTPVTKRKFKISSKALPWLLIAPALIIIFAFSIFPLLYALNVSFRYRMLTDIIHEAFVGLKNYREALADPFVGGAVKKTILFTVLALVIEIPLGTAIAFLLNKKFKFQGIVRALLLIPMACAPLAIGLIWRSMYHPEFGVWTYFAKALGFQAPNFLGNKATALMSIVVFDVWQWTPFVTFIVLAGLGALRKEPYEAAQIDGASGWQVFRHLTLPMLTPLLFVAFLLRLLDLIRYYDGIYALTMGGPGTATETISWYLYRIGFKYVNMGYASAISIVFLYFAIILSVVALRSINKVSEI